MSQTLKEMTQSRKMNIGTTLVEFDTPGIGHICKSAGAEFVLIDMEYSGFSYNSLKRLLCYLQAAELPSIVRVPTSRFDHINRALDVGADGIMASPNTAEDCHAIVDAMKYAPQGSRNLAVGVALDRYAPRSVVQKMRAANRAIPLFALIENAEAIENIEAIAAVKGVDCLWPGPNDLAYSLGVPGEITSRTYRRAERKLVAAGLKHGKSLARIAADARAAGRLYQQGYDMLVYSGDVWLMEKAMRTGIADLRAKWPRRPPPGRLVRRRRSAIMHRTRPRTTGGPTWQE